MDKDIVIVSNYRTRNKEGWNAYQRQYQQKKRQDMKRLKEIEHQLNELNLLDEQGELRESFLKTLLVAAKSGGEHK